MDEEELDRFVYDVHEAFRLDASAAVRSSQAPVLARARAGKAAHFSNGDGAVRLVVLD